jgi:hypothetical protein
MANDGEFAIWMRSRLDTLDIHPERAAGLGFPAGPRNSKVSHDCRIEQGFV